MHFVRHEKCGVMTATPLGWRFSFEIMLPYVLLRLHLEPGDNYSPSPSLPQHCLQLLCLS